MFISIEIVLLYYTVCCIFLWCRVCVCVCVCVFVCLLMHLGRKTYTAKMNNISLIVDFETGKY